MDPKLTPGTGMRSIIRNGAFLMGSNWIETVLRAAYLLVITRYLGAELYGVWAYALAAYGFVLGLTGFGFDMLVPMRLGRRKGDAADFVGLTLALRLGLLALAAAGFAGYALLAEPLPQARAALILVIPALAARGVALWARSVFVGFERAGAYVRIAVAIRLAEVACGTGLLVMGGGLLAILALHSLAWTAEATIGLLAVRRKLTPLRPRLHAARARELLRQGAVLGLAAALTGWLGSGPLLLLRHASGDLATLGQLGLALQVGTLLALTAQPFLSAAQPVLSRSDAREDPRVASYGALAALAVLVVSGFAAGLAFLFGPELMVWVFGPDFAPAGKLLAPSLLIGGLMLAPAGYLQVLVVRGRRWPGAIASGLGGLVLLVAFPPAVAGWGVDGAVLATVAAWLTRAGAVLALATIGSNAVRSAES